MSTDTLSRFLDAQNQVYLKALQEIRTGRKTSHWMWYVFPQIKGLGKSDTAKFYAIEDIDQARAYLLHPVLGKNLIEISQAVLQLEGKTANQIFGSPDDLKLCSCMTLFANVKDSDPVFKNVINTFFKGIQDQKTLDILQQEHL
ncbi:DUF1810 domain-containing protein [Cytophagaceae bacterium DM2B3-1]|uniref:DUF1810 domain-containing protein n=1 Tax=Xanthocytophaga flava TaxID=3048013 RepID=A0AAE3QKW9_9BACT|nr:DUF1810 domain-containing protein [Xanthocytophaga flavus]MDJ1480810.1 DUF1810 domain-containing protein [Xanthocytophaga flavus]MDJ1493494.1 DUF1810 domain-containing protein [Xanthocytophaga flavus]